MKKFVILLIAMLMLSCAMPIYAVEPSPVLIENAQIIFKAAETPNRVEISFSLTEPIDLSQENSNVIFEYFATDESGELVAMNYIKDKSWSGYMNIYEDYPTGEQKYSSGSSEGDCCVQIRQRR